MNSQLCDAEVSSCTLKPAAWNPSHMRWVAEAAKARRMEMVPKLSTYPMPAEGWVRSRTTPGALSWTRRPPELEATSHSTNF